MKPITSKRINLSLGVCVACMHTNPVANSISLGRLLQEQQQELWTSSSLHPSRVHLQTSHVALCYPVQVESLFCAPPPTPAPLSLFHEKRNCVMEKNRFFEFYAAKTCVIEG